MSAEEVKYRVRLDLTQAKADINEMMRELDGAAHRQSKTISGALKSSVQWMSAGALMGAGIAGVKAATQSGVGDIAGETFSYLGQQLNNFFLGKLDDESRATRATREEAISSFARVIGHNHGEIPPQLHSWFKARTAIMTDFEVGKSAIESDALMKGPGLTDLVERIIKGLGKMVADGFKELGKALAPWR